ncbi:hypothetical protein [Nocardioides sambongensis]|uniref:hypothetical protein n=1 Tax=Nocardioides sambongensis TaxID=2589074 RepID=UPI001127152E|nr:hypothetical protein [Nocardioides sambongensis]
MATNDEIARAAIKADMEHRGYRETGPGEFHRSVAAGAMGHVKIEHWVWAADGRVHTRIEESPPYRATDFAAEEAALANALQLSVFGYWPSAIDGLFADWEPGVLPCPMPFEIAASLARAAVSEISAGVVEEDPAAGYAPGNPRLASDLSNLEERTKQLSGRYAATFADTYVTPLPAVIERQRSMVGVLAVAAAAEGEVWARAADDVAEVRRLGLAAMQGSGTASEGDIDWSVVLTVVGAVAAGVTAFATVGSTAAVAAALLSAGAGGAGDLIASPSDDSAPELPLGAGDPHAVLANLRAALSGSGNSLSASIRSQERSIRQMLAAVSGAARGARRGMFDLPEPEVADVGAGDLLDRTQSVIVTPEIIARITALWIPTISADLRTARRLLVWESAGAWQRPAGIGLGVAGPMAAYQELQETALRLLGNTAGELDDAGVALGDAARMIGLVDAQVERSYARQARRIIDLNLNHVA